MAVVQISKIQVRRGQKNLTGSVPQLSSAEFAWAVDTQELFIGNGSVAEGAPAVGNTKILTEHDNILELAGSYTFAANDVSISLSVPRSLQTKIDEIQVSIVDFGANPDGSSDNTVAFATALSQLFENSNDKYKKVLMIPNGTYIISSDLIIPSNVTIRGENKNFTILQTGNSNLIFQDVTGRARNIKIENLTIEHDLGQTITTNSEGCDFEDVIWRSNYRLGDTVFVPENANCQYIIPTITSGGNISVSGAGVSSTITQAFSVSFSNTLSSIVGTLNGDATFSLNFFASVEGATLKIQSLLASATAASVQSNFTVESQSNNLVPVETVVPELFEYTDGSANVTASVFWENNLFGTRTENLKFSKCKWEYTKLAVECQRTFPVDTTLYDTYVYFKDCEFFNNDTSIYIGGIVGQGNKWTIEDTKFTEIANQALRSTEGRGTVMSRCKFINCGNGINSSDTPTSSIVYFGESIGNTLVDCSSNRHQESAIIAATNIENRVEFENVSKASLIDRNYSEIYLSDAPRPLCQFSNLNRYIYLDYRLRLDQHTRTGQILIVINTEGTDVEISDEYNYSGGGIIMTGFEFTAELISTSTFDDSSEAAVDTVILKYVNPVLTGKSGTIEYNITYGV